MTPLATRIAGELGTETPPQVRAAARMLADMLGGAAVLFYGSVLRTGDFSGVLDFYVLTDAPPGRGLRRLANRWLWPDVSYHELPVGDAVIRAKVATMPLAVFARAATGETRDTTIWTRFVQPAALAWSRDRDAEAEVFAAVEAAAITAARFAAVLGPERGAPRGKRQQSPHKG